MSKVLTIAPKRHARMSQKLPDAIRLHVTEGLSIVAASAAKVQADAGVGLRPPLLPPGRPRQGGWGGNRRRKVDTRVHLGRFIFFHFLNSCTSWMTVILMILCEVGS